MVNKKFCICGNQNRFGKFRTGCRVLCLQTIQQGVGNVLVLATSEVLHETSNAKQACDSWTYQQTVPREVAPFLDLKSSVIGDRIASHF